MSATVLEPIVMTCDRCKADTPVMFVPGMNEAVKKIRGAGWRQDEHTESYQHGAKPDPSGYVPDVLLTSQRIIWDETVCPDCVKKEGAG